MGPSQILIVDDEIGIRELLSEILEDEGYQVRQAENASEARSFRSHTRPDLVLLDIWMPDTDGVSLLKEWSSQGLLTMPVVMMSGHATIDTAVEATRIGAFDFLEKPIAMQKLLATVGRALARSPADVPVQPMSLRALGSSAVVEQLRRRLDQVANLRQPVLLQGAPGAAFEACARYLHRPGAPWIAPESTSVLLEPSDELLARARDGTLFFREASDLNRMEQRGLLLLAGAVESCNARLICGTSRPLAELTARGQFDARLLQALSACTVAVPALADHREDIPEIARTLLARMVESGEAPPRTFSTAALNALRNGAWPGDLAQLESVVRSLAQTAAGDEIGAEDVERLLPKAAPGAAGAAVPLDLPLREARERFERLYFEHHIGLEAGNISRVAEKAGLERTHLYRKLKQLGIRVPGKSGD